MKYSFEETNKDDVQEAKPQVESTSTALVERPNLTPSTYVQDDEAQGELTQDDQEKAYLSIVAKTGELSNLFTPGDLVLNGEFVIGGTKNPIEVVPMAFEKLYQNDLHLSLKEFGAEVKSATDVLDRGGVVEYRPHEDKLSRHFWKPILKVLFLVKRPVSITPDAAVYFPFEIEGSDYGVIGYTARTKTAYNGIAVPLTSVKRSGKSIRAKTYRLSTKGEDWESPSGESRSWIQASLRAVGETSVEVLNFIKQNK